MLLTTGILDCPREEIKYVQDGHRCLACHSTLLLALRENDLFQFLKCKMYVEWTFKIMYVVQAFHLIN